MLPNLIIPGAQKSGTSSLYHYLKQHPECVMSDPKEPSFFSRVTNLRNLDKYASCFGIAERTGRLPKIVGEATTAYMVEDYVPKRIKNVLGNNVKFVFILRNPVARTISAYWHLYKRSHETRSIHEVLRFDSDDEEEVIAQESERIQMDLERGRIIPANYESRYDDYLWPFHYVRNSLYSRHIARFVEYFDSKNLLLIFTEELASQPRRVFCEVEKFLGIDDTFIPEDIGVHFNRTFISRNGELARLIRSFANSAVASQALRKYQLVDRIFRWMIMKEKPKTDGGIKLGLQKIFTEESIRLFDIFSLDTSNLWP